MSTFTVSASTETAYAKFRLQQYNQTNNIRMVQLQTNGTFSYSTPGEHFNG